jgi:adenylate cyclase
MGRQVAEGGEHWMDAELHRVEGELWQIEGPSSYSRAEACMRQAVAVARVQSSRMLELRAVTSLARLWQQQGRQDEALAILESAITWFTEGNENVDLREAAALLNTLS